MKSAFVGIVLAVVFFVAAAASWSEARLTRSIAEAHRRLATLHYDADDGLDAQQSVWTGLPWPDGAGRDDIERQRATVNYWRTQYESLNELTAKAGQQALTDPRMLLVIANASYRAAAPTAGPPRAAVTRLDTVIQSYADVLRRDPNAIDAAYNYEFASRQRDQLARAAAGRATPRYQKPDGPVDTTVDLPAGPTIHGLPGGPPPGTDMSEFKTLSPMRYDEREEQTDPGRGGTVQRKG